MPRAATGLPHAPVRASTTSAEPPNQTSPTAYRAETAAATATTAGRACGTGAWCDPTLGVS